MLEIKTIVHRIDDSDLFDDYVNDAIEKGWELVRRDIVTPHAPDRYTLLYAELERIIEEESKEPEFDGSTAVWEITRDPHYPYKCSACGCKTAHIVPKCPLCDRIMREAEE